MHSPGLAQYMHEFRGNSWLTNLLRVLAITGTGAVLVREMLVAQPLQQNQYYSFFALIFVAIVVFASIFAAFPAIMASVLRKPDILVPIGVYVTASELLGIIWTKIAIAGADISQVDFGAMFTHASLPISLVMNWACQFILAAFFAGWMTRTILTFGKSGEVDIALALTGIGNWFPRAFGVMLLGFAPFGLFLFPAVLTIVVGGKGDLLYVFFLFLIPLTAIGTLLWNLATYGVLAHVLNAQDVPLREAIREGIRVSWLNKAKVAAPLVALLLVSGWVAFVMVNTHRYDESGDDFGKITKTLTNDRQTNLNASFVWTAGYPESTGWYKGLMKAAKAKPLHSVDLRVMLLMLLFSVVINIKIIAALLGNDGLSRTESAVYSGGGTGAGILIFAALAVAMIPFEFIGAIGNTERFTGAQKDDAENEMIIVPKTYKGWDRFRKKEIFRNAEPEEKLWGTLEITTVGGGRVEVKEENLEKFAEITKDSDNDAYADINAIYAGEIDDEAGVDILVAGRKKGWILSADGEVKREFQYKLGKYWEDSMWRYYDIPFAKIVDLNGDGKPEIAGTGSNTGVVIDLDGNPLWKYPGKSDPDIIRVGDIDRDGTNEILIGSDKDIEAFTISGELLWRSKVETFGIVAMEIADLDGDGDTDIVVDDEIFDKTGRRIGKAEKPAITAGFLNQRDEPFGFLYIRENVLGLFNSDKLAAKYDAPHSFRVARKKRYEPYDLVNTLQVFSAEGIKVRFEKDRQKYLAVSAVVSGTKESFKTLYIYDSKGELLLHETFASIEDGFAILQNEDGTESLLMNDNGKLLKYSI